MYTYNIIYVYMYDIVQGGYMNTNIDHPNAPAAKQISAQRLMQIKAEIAKLKQKVEHGGGVQLALVDRLERYSNSVKRDLLQRQKRPITVSKEKYYSAGRQAGEVQQHAQDESGNMTCILLLI